MNLKNTISFILIVTAFSCTKPKKKASLQKQDSHVLPFVNSLQETTFGDSTYLIKLPKNYGIHETLGDEFYVYFFEPINQKTAIPFSGGIYFGENPPNENPWASVSKPYHLKGKLFGFEITWKSYLYLGEYSIETNVNLPGMGNVYAFGGGNNLENLAKVIYVFKSIQLNKN